MPALVSELREGYATLSGLLVAAAAGTTVSYFLGNGFVDRLSAKRVLAAGFIAFLLGALPLPFVRAYPVWLVAIFMAGFGLSLIDVSGARIAHASGRGREGAALSTLNVFFSIGAVIGPVIVALGGAAGVATGWAWLGPGALAVAGLGILGRAKGDGLPQRAAPPPAAPRAEARRRGGVWIWTLAAAMFVYTASEAGFGSWFAAFAHARAGVPSWEAALFVTVFWGGFIPSRLFVTGRMGVWRLERLIVVGGLLGSLGEAASALLGQSVWGVLAGAFVAGLGFGPCFPATLALAGQGAAGMEGWSFGRLYSSLAISLLVGPWALGRIFTVSPDAAVYTMAALALAMGVIIALYRSPSPPPLPSAQEGAERALSP